MQTLAKLVVLSLLVSLAPAQRNSNDTAPTATNALSFDKDTQITVSYTSFTTAGGGWLRQLYELGDVGVSSRKYYNEQYITSRLKGSLKVSQDVQLAGNPLTAGSYKLTFRIDQDLVWHLVVLSDKDQEICAIAMNTERDDKHAANRLSITPVAAAEGKQGSLHIHFGPLHADVPFTVGKAAAAAPAKKPEAAGAKKN